MSLIKIINYSTKTKKEPFVDWVDDQDMKVQAIVYSRLDRVSLGNFGDCTQIKGGNGV